MAPEIIGPSKAQLGQYRGEPLAIYPFPLTLDPFPSILDPFSMTLDTSASAKTVLIDEVPA